MWDGHLDRVNVAKHRIMLIFQDAPPIHSKRYNAGPKQRELERKEKENMREAGVAEPAVTEWASRVVLVPKKDSSLQFCVNYLRLNAVKKKR